MREFNQPEEQNNNSQTIRNKSRNHSREESIIRESADVPIQSESIASVVNVPLSSSVERIAVLSDSFKLERLNQPGEVEKLVPNNRFAQRDVRRLLAKSMPVAAKKRKLNEMLEVIANTSVVVRQEEGTSNAQQNNQRTAQDYAQSLIDRFVKQPTRVITTYRSV